MCSILKIGTKNYHLDNGVLLPGACKALRFKPFFCLRNENPRWKHTTLGSLHVDGIWEQGAPIDVPENLKIILGRDMTDGLFGIFTTTLEDIVQVSHGYVLRRGCLKGAQISDLALSAMDRCARRNNRGRTAVLFEPKAA